MSGEKNMPTSIKHIGIGFVAGALAYAVYKYSRKEEITLEGITKSGMVGGTFSLTPDFLEPPTNPNHRAFAHSVVAMMAGSYGGYKGLQNGNLDEETKELLIAALAGYGSHILADGMTPKSIPMLG